MVDEMLPETLMWVEIISCASKLMNIFTNVSRDGRMDKLSMVKSQKECLIFLTNQMFSTIYVGYCST